MAEPMPVRRAEGTVPRQKAATALGERAMSRMAERIECELDCWTRVLRRSKGCRSTAPKTPVLRPATKWKAGWRAGVRVNNGAFCLVIPNPYYGGLVGLLGFVAYNSTTCRAGLPAVA